MKRLHSVLCGAALAALLPLAACSSDGRISTAGGFGQSPSPGPSSRSPSGGGDPATPPDGDDSTTLGAAVVATAGNLGDAVGRGGEPEDITDAVNPLARVSVADETLAGQGRGSSALGLSVASETQEQGDVATLGVLAGGEVLTADTSGLSNGASDLLGVTADGEQIIGEGDEQTIAVGALSPRDATGEVASVNVLSGDQTVDVQVDGVTTSLVEGVVNGLSGLNPDSD